MRQAGLIAVAVVLCLTGIAAARSSAEKVKVNVSAEKPAPDGTQVIKVTLDIEEGYHLFANPSGNELLETAATKVRIDGDIHVGEMKIDYPKGLLVEDRDVGNYYVYEGKVLIKATVKRREGCGPLTVSVKVQAWDSKHLVGCLLPATLRHEID